MKPTLDIPLGVDRQLALREIIGDRWSAWLLIAVHETDGALFSELAAYDGLSRRVLSERLVRLSERGLLRAEVYSNRPLRRRYFLSERGLSVRRLLIAATHVAAGGILAEDPLENVSHAAGSTGHANAEVDAADRLFVQNLEQTERVYEQSIAPLDRYDEHHRSQLVETLELWLASDGSTSVTAARMYAHRHTIRYRLARIREITGMDLGSTVGRERALLGLRARRALQEFYPRG